MFIQIFVVFSEIRMCFATECVMALQGHARSLILAPIKSAYATAYWLSIVTLVISCHVSEISQVFCWKERPHLLPIPPAFGNVSLGRCCGSEERRP